MKVLLYNYFGSYLKALLIICGLILLEFFNLLQNEMLFLIILISYSNEIIERGRFEGWSKRIKTLPISAKDVYLSKTLSFILYSLFIFATMIFMKMIVYGIDLSQGIHSPIRYSGITYFELISKYLNIMFLALILFTLDILLNSTIFKKRENSIKFGFIGLYVYFLLPIILDILNIVDFENSKNLLWNRGNFKTGAIGFLIAITMNLIVNAYLILKEES